MPATLMRMPIFQQDQQVGFVGGEGIVRSYKPEDGAWTYLIEMPLGLKPAFGRIGAETMILLAEKDLWSHGAETDRNFSITPEN